MRALLALSIAVLTSSLTSSTVRAQDEEPLVFDGPVQDDGQEFFEIAFEVPEGTEEVQITHAPGDPEDVLDWGLFDPDGFRGYGGGNLDVVIVGAEASSLSYLPGPVQPGTWRIYVGKARLVSAAPSFHVEVVLRTTATLEPSTDRTIWEAPAPLTAESRFYAGDFHVHSEDSGDADATLDEIGVLAEANGLDFVVITDHNTTSQVDRLLQAQQRVDGTLLYVPGVEFTTYAGHATGFGSTRFVDHRIGFQGRTLDAAIEQITSEGALFSINHPALDLGDVCIGCAWEHDVATPGTIHGVEIQTGRTLLFADAAIAFWERMLDEGHHLAALGGSDDHQAGRDNAAIGEPTTLVFAADLSVASLRTGILHSRTVVKMQDPSDPMVELDTDPARTGDTAVSGRVFITAIVTGGIGKTFRFVENGLGVALPEPILEDPQSFTIERLPDDSGLQRVRAEVADDDGTPRTLTSYVWLRAAPPDPGCGCHTASPAGPWALLACLALIWAKSRRWRVS